MTGSRDLPAEYGIRGRWTGIFSFTRG